MKIEPLILDIAAPQKPGSSPSLDGSLFTEAYDRAASLLDQAQSAERNFARGEGSLLAMTTARAEADIALSTATAIASRLGQCASIIANMSL
jgi:flagellar hook-basal body complex protein FliE